MQVKRVLGIDPGGTTGLVIVEKRGSADGGLEPGLEVVQAREVTLEEFGYVTEAQKRKGLRGGTDGLAFYKACEGVAEEVYAWGMNSVDELHCVVMEDFILRPGAYADRRLVAPVVILGLMLMEDWCAPVVLNSAAMKASRRCSDERLKRLGLWHKGSTHIRDATRHALLRL